MHSAPFKHKPVYLTKKPYIYSRSKHKRYFSNKNVYTKEHHKKISQNKVSILVDTTNNHIIESSPIFNGE